LVVVGVLVVVIKLRLVLLFENGTDDNKTRGIAARGTRALG